MLIAKKNYRKLKARIKELYDTQDKFVEELNNSGTLKISVCALNLKLNNRSELKLNEMIVLSNKLQIADDEIHSYFFDMVIAKGQTNN